MGRGLFLIGVDKLIKKLSKKKKEGVEEKSLSKEGKVLGQNLKLEGSLYESNSEGNKVVGAKTSFSDGKKDSKRKISAETAMGYALKEDGTLVLGTKAELEGKFELFEGLSAETYTAIKTNVELIDKGYMLGVKGGGSVQHTDKLQVGSSELSLDSKADVQLKAVANLLTLTAELGVNVGAGVKIEAKGFKLDLDFITIQGFLQAEAVAEASARCKISPTGVLAEAKATAEAKAKAGVSFVAPICEEYKISLKFEPTIEAYARASAEAIACASLTKTGVKVGASAAVGVRVKGKTAILGTAKYSDGWNPKVVKTLEDSDMGTASLQAELEFVAGAEFEVTFQVFDEVTDRYTGLVYYVTSITVKADVPAMEGVGGGLGVTVELTILKDLFDKFMELLKNEIKKQVIKMIPDIVNKKYQELLKEADKLKDVIKNSASKMAFALIDLIGFHVTATDKELERQNIKIVLAFGEIMKTDGDEKSVKYLAGRYQKYHEYLTTAFDNFTKNLPVIAKTATAKISEIDKEGLDKEEKIKVLEKMKVKVDEVLKTLKKLSEIEQKLLELAEVDPELTKLPNDLISALRKKSDFMKLFTKEADKLMVALLDAQGS